MFLKTRLILTLTASLSVDYHTIWLKEIFIFVWHLFSGSWQENRSLSLLTSLRNREVTTLIRRLTSLKQNKFMDATQMWNLKMTCLAVKISDISF